MKKICKTIKGDRQLLAGMIGIVILLALVILAPVVASENPHHYGKDILNSLGQNGHLLGTNHMGQDIYSMIIYGVRTSLRVAVISALISGVLGVLIGGVAGFFGGKVDTFVSELINVFMKQYHKCYGSNRNHDMAKQCKADACPGTFTETAHFRKKCGGDGGDETSDSF